MLSNKLKTVTENTSDFVPFTLKEQLEFIKFSSEFPVHADLSFNNLMTWMSLYEELLFVRINKNYIFLFRDFSSPGRELSITIVGKLRPADTWKKMLYLQKIISKKEPVAFRMLPDYFVEAVSRQRPGTLFHKDSANSDYLLSVEDLLYMKGGGFQEFRHQVTYFMKHYSQDCRIIKMNMSSSTDRKTILEHIQLWDKQTVSTDENKVIKKRLQLNPDLILKHSCIGILINERLAGFSIYHLDAKHQIAIGSHLRYNPSYKRMFDFMVFITAVKLKEQKIQIINSEQDLGISGLRKHKQSYQPIGYLNKYYYEPSRVAL